jgi:lactoylglutathione lyase
MRCQILAQALCGAALLLAAAAPAVAQDAKRPAYPPGLEIGFDIPKPPAIIFEARDVADMDKAVAFYTKALGMKKVGGNEPPGGDIKEVFVGFGTDALSAKVLLAQHKKEKLPPHHGAGTRLIMSVSDLDATLKAVAANGGKVTTPPLKAGGANLAWVADPDGYEIELSQP